MDTTNLSQDLLKTRDKQTGGPVSLPAWKRSLMWRGALLGALTGALLTFIIFGLAANSLEMQNWGFIVGIATAIAFVHGAVVGPLVTLVLSRGQAQRYLNV